MIKKILYFTFIVIFGSTLSAQNFWKDAKEKIQVKNNYTKINNRQFYHLAIDNFSLSIKDAPSRKSKTSSFVHLSFPVDNSYENFEIYKVSTLDQELSKKFPTIQSYIGITKDKNLKIRITLTPQGVFGMIWDSKKTIYINPLSKKNLYEVYTSKDINYSNNIICSVEKNKEKLFNKKSENLVDDGVLREYRLAVATTGEYSQYHINNAGVNGGTNQQKKNAVLSAIVVTIDRVNQIYERDLSITFTLVNGNENLIFLNGNTDPFSNNNRNSLIDESQTEIDNIIGTNNYDVGHTFSTGAGGLAEIYSACDDAIKARGVTGTSAPIGDPYDIDFVCHEIGHQFGANHTFNGNLGSCGGINRNPPTAVEPGSGSTIMAYAGICLSQNLQNNSDPYFHVISIDEIYNFISSPGGADCYTPINIPNNPPTILPVTNYTIPFGTAFILNCEATDINNDNLTYTWEQVDAGITTVPPSPTATDGALFRSFAPSNSSNRFFPVKDSVLNNNLTPPWEVIPSVAREMNFTVTVRDNNIAGGQNTIENVNLTVADVGPFKVTSQNSSGIEYNPNDLVNITWNVAGTNANNINTQFVNVLLSHDGGQNFSEVLVLNTPNDGTENILIPNGITSNECRIKIEAVNNVYYAVNEIEFMIKDPLNTLNSYVNENYKLYPNPSKGIFNIEIEKKLSNEHIRVNIYNISGRKIYTNEYSSANDTMSVNASSFQQGVYLVEVISANKKTIKKLIIK